MCGARCGPPPPGPARPLVSAEYIGVPARRWGPLCLGPCPRGQEERPGLPFVYQVDLWESPALGEAGRAEAGTGPTGMHGEQLLGSGLTGLGAPRAEKPGQCSSRDRGNRAPPPGFRTQQEAREPLGTLPAPSGAECPRCWLSGGRRGPALALLLLPQVAGGSAHCAVPGLARVSAAVPLLLLESDSLAVATG